jgi:hypothetical protein
LNGKNCYAQKNVQRNNFFFKLQNFFQLFLFDRFYLIHIHFLQGQGTPCPKRLFVIKYIVFPSQWVVCDGAVSKVFLTAKFAKKSQGTQNGNSDYQHIAPFA